MNGQRKRQGGFSLVELMVVLVIIGILGAIAVPAYTGYVLRTHRTTAQALLSEQAQFMERYYTTNSTYAGGALITAVLPRGAAGAAIRYNISFSAGPDADGFTLQAAPANVQLDDECGTLTLSGTGAHGAASAGCW